MALPMRVEELFVATAVVTEVVASRQKGQDGG